MHLSTNRGPAALNFSPLLDENLELVKRIAWRLHRRLPSCVDIEDLVQAGVIGLLEAQSRYQEDESASFATFAGIRIRGAMLDEIRRGDWAPRSLHRSARALAQARHDVERRCGGAASAPDVAAEMGMALPEYRRLCDDIGLAHLASLDATLADQPGLEVCANDSAMPENEVEHDDMCRAVMEASQSLPEREQMLLHLYYEAGENLRQIAERMGVSESRVCQLHGRAIRQMRDLIGEAA
ncbi:RNA polymerase sigma factor FliA [Salinisphaera aquimarina]|uniref:RNA polymerase sigma factor FliA n=1 Tax=Salinisphaera aquimarina TaxID=2094031 RepID=A0ABV7EQT2_9GAMM